MSFQIKRGLAEFGYPDHFAVLGLEVSASAAEIRKRYLKLARILHPDSCDASLNKAQASQVLSKLVNPAYQFLSQEKERADYGMLLKLVGQRANLEFDSAKFRYQTPKDLLTSDRYEDFYRSTVQELAQTQFSQLDRVVDVIEQISELNLAFLLRRELMQPLRSQPASSEQSPHTVVAKPSSPDVSIETPTKTPMDQAVVSPSEEYIRQYIRRAEDYISKNLSQPAIQELRAALKLDPQNFRGNLLLGSTYLRLKQPKMAKEYLLKAQKSQPANAELQQLMNELKKQEALAVSKVTQPGTKATQAGVKIPGRGPFGWFGTKK
ncbi:DnaJ domain-containing protein [Altericista sp. CCNU0014]|uniref:DnaJ domain-containing protein n=1 Tax=Altericista sp. CCNU0014 TaxID=3082949 RepID=UPI00384D5462